MVVNGTSWETAALPALCRGLTELRHVAEESGRGPDFDALIDAARQGQPLAPHAHRLGLSHALVSGGARGAEPGAATGPEGVVELLRREGGHVPQGAYRCPVGRCRRVERPAPGEDLPVCGIHGRPLRFG